MIIVESSNPSKVLSDIAIAQSSFRCTGGDALSDGAWIKIDWMMGCMVTDGDPRRVD
jgi:hypothetical protein